MKSSATVQVVNMGHLSVGSGSLQYEDQGVAMNQPHASGSHQYRLAIEFDPRVFESYNSVQDTKTNGASTSEHKSLVVFNPHPETMRIYSYILFWIMMALCIILTEVYVDPEKVNNNPLSKTVKYNNLCAYFDFPPSRYVAAMIFPVVLIFYFSYVFLSWMRMRKASVLGIVSRRYAFVFETLLVIEVFFIMWFQMVFVVDVEVNVLMHSLSFVSLQIGLLMNAFSSYAYYSRVVKFTSCQLCFALTYLVLFVIVTVVKNTITLSALNGTPILNYDAPNRIIFARTVDAFWMIFGAVTPLFIAYFLRRESSKMTFTF